MTSSHHREPISIDVGSVFESPGEGNAQREQTLSKSLDTLNELGRHDSSDVDPIGSFFYPVLRLQRLNVSSCS
jgi:hypothetical protein